MTAPEFHVEASNFTGFLIDLDETIYAIKRMKKLKVEPTADQAFDRVIAYLEATKAMRQAKRLQQ